MNKENIQKIIDVLKSEEGLEGVTFDMTTFYKEDEICGTAACIAGHAALLADYPLSRRCKPAQTYSVAKGWFDLTTEDADRLFYAFGIPIYDATKPVAIAALEHLRDTGEVNWQLAAKRIAEKA